MNPEDNVLKSESRSQILRGIIERPGSTFTELMRALEMKEGTLRYHLRYLQKKDMVKLEERRGKKRYFSTTMQSLKKGSGVHFSPFQKKVLSNIEDDPGIDQRTLVRRTRTNRYLLSYHLGRLMEIGLIRKEKDGKNVRYFRMDLDELKKRMLLGLVDDLLTGEITEDRYLEIRGKIKRLK